MYAPSFVQGASLGGNSHSYVRWTWAADFSRGIRGWLTYPLSQDIGYDPTLYTTDISGSRCLVRDVKSYGQHVLRIGLIKPQSFRVTRDSQFKLNYQLKISGSVKAVTLRLAAENGKLYKTSLPHKNGANSLIIQGTTLGVPAAGTDIQAIVLEAIAESPIPGSSNRLFLRELEIVAERHRELPLLKPELVRSASEGPLVAERPVEVGGPLTIEARFRKTLKISLYDAEGRRLPVMGKRLEGSGQKITYQISFPQPLHPGLYRAVVDSGAAQSKFQFLVLGKVPPHPRVLLTTHRLDELRSLDASSPFLAALRAKAQSLRSALAYGSYAGTNIALLPSTSVFPGLPEYFSLLENYSNSIAFNAVEYRLTGDQAALEATRKGLLTISSWPTWTPAWFGAHGLRTYYEVGVFSQRVAVGYDLIANQLTHAEKEQITEALWRNGINPTVVEYFTNNRMPISASNWMANSVGGALAMVVALYGDLPEWNVRLGTAMAELNVAYRRLLAGLFPGDGSEAEPAGYQDFAMEGISFGMAALHALGIRPPGTGKMIESFWWPRYAEVTPGLVLDTGDFNGQLRALSGFAWEAEHSNDASLRAFYDTAEAGSLLGVAKVQATGRTLEAAPGLLDLTCCSRPAQPAPVPPPSRIFPERGSVVLRSGWKPTDTVISIRVGPWFNHEHHDQGSFQVAAFGHKLISEAGYADYYKDLNYPTYFMQAPGHNTVLVDGDPFSQPGEGGRYWKALARYPHFQTHVLSPGVDYLSAELADAYGDELTTFQREFIFLKPDVLIICDRLQAPSLHRYAWLLHVPLGAETSIRGVNASISVNDAFATLTSVGENDRWMLQKTPLASDRYIDLDRHHLSQPYEFVLNSDKSLSTTFLVGMKFEQTAHPPEPLTPVNKASQKGFIDRSGGWSWVSRAATGALEMDGVTGHGQSLGIKNSADAVHVFGTAISSLYDNDKLLLESTTPISLSFKRTTDSEDIYFDTEQRTSLEIAAIREPKEVLLDGHQMHAATRAGLVVLKGIDKGEHVVAIHY